MDSRDLGLLIIALGVVTLLIGALVMFGAFHWFGRLPGDIRIESGGTRIYIPITTMILLSVLLSLLAAILRRFQ